MVYNTSYIVIDETEFKINELNLSEFRNSQIENLPLNIPEPHGIGFIMRYKVDADHVANTVNNLLRTVFFFF